MSEKAPQHESKTKKIIKGTALTLAGVAAGGAAVYALSPNHDNRPTPSVTAEKFNDEAAFQRQGLKMAFAVIDILRNPQNGAKHYEERGQFAGFDNKGYVIGKDRKVGTPDDGKATAEARMYYADGKINFLATDMEGAETKAETDDRFDSVEVRVTVDPDSGLAQKTRDGEAVTIRDFEEALGGIGDGGASVESFEGSDSANYNSDTHEDVGVSYQVGKNKAGQVKAAIDRGIVAPDINEEGGAYSPELSDQLDKLIDESIKGVS